jgi:creatinine amidohydrolase
MTEVEWARLTAPEVRALAGRGRALAVLPVGALEQHGPHLPTCTDSLIATALAVRAARLAGPTEPALVLPAVWTGLSAEHLPLGGTIALDFAALSGVLRGVVRSLRALGFARLLVVNGHGGNDEALAVCCRELAVEFGFPIVAAMPWRLVPDTLRGVLETQSGVRHACEAETSVMLALAPELVRSERMQPPDAGGVAADPALSRFWSFAERAPASGVRGDPRSASAVKGEKLLAAMAEALAAAIRDITLWRTPDPVYSPGRGLGAAAP